MHRSFGADIVAAAGSVLDDELLAHSLRQVLADDARQDVGAAARRVGDDPAHRPGGIIQRLDMLAADDKSTEGDQECLHGRIYHALSLQQSQRSTAAWATSLLSVETGYAAPAASHKALCDRGRPVAGSA